MTNEDRTISGAELEDLDPNASQESAASVTAVCPSCGRDLVPGSRFCDGCGASLTSSASGPATAPPPPVTTPWSGSFESQTMPPSDEAEVPTARTRRAKRTVILAGAGVVALVAAVVVGWSILSGGGDEAMRETPLPRVADDVEERWSVDIDGARDVTGSASAVFVLAIDDDDAEIVALAGGSGDERWTTEVGRNVSFGSLVGVADGVVVGEFCDFDGNCESFGVSASSGEVLWSDELDGRLYLSEQGSLLLEESSSLEVIDPREGDRLERVRGDMISVQGDYAYVRDDDEVEVFDISDLSSVFGPVDVDDDSFGAVFQKGQLITAVDDELVVIDRNGDVDRESRVPADEISRVLPGPEGTVIVSTDDGVFGVRPTDGRAEEVWESDGWVSLGFVSADGPVVIVYEDNGSDAELLDARTGESLLDLRDYFETDQLIGTNGLVNLAYGDETEATAFRYSDGEELWQEDFDGFLRLLDNGLVEVDDDEVRFYR